MRIDIQVDTVIKRCRLKACVFVHAGEQCPADCVRLKEPHQSEEHWSAAQEAISHADLKPDRLPLLRETRTKERNQIP